MTAAAAGGAVWPVEWLDSTAQQRSGIFWRGVEAQHIVATMRLVDSLEEQAVLENLLESSKPPLPVPEQPVPQQPAHQHPEQPERHHLLTTPIRYRSPFASRFRRAHRVGVWCGAQTLKPAAAEVACWRWRFLVASSGLENSELHTQHTFFQAQVAGQVIDLGLPPWSTLEAMWTQDRDYSATHDLAAAARAAGVQWLRYPSALEVGGHCAAVFNAHPLNLQQPHAPQTWHCRTTAHSVWLGRQTERSVWTFQPPPPPIAA